MAAELAGLAKSLEAACHAPHAVAGFLTRCLFSMFAEDVGLLPASPDGGGSFAHLLRQHREQPATLAQMLKVFWAGMDAGGFNAAIAADVLRFNGKLFKGAGLDGYVLPLTTAQIDGLLRAASANWQEVEPAIFGTLLERALDATERHALGAHYTPRAYVERLVLPTVVEPLRADWANAQAAAVLLAREASELEGKKRDAKLAEARTEIKRFHHQLCTTRVLDPACGSGNFLYVTLEHLKRLEGEVINQLEALGMNTDAVRQDTLAIEGETVTLQQLRGIELNERAAALAELVLWIGWLQWQVRTRGLASVAEPVVHDYRNIEHRDAVLAFDSQAPALDASGKTITRWDGTTFKTHPVTGEAVPDEAAQVVQWRYANPRPAEWPTADFIVGNPPFIGAGAMRAALGDGYATTLRAAWPDVPESADFVMYWWHHAACLVRSGAARRFGFITTNSLRQTFNRRVVQAALDGEVVSAAAGHAGGLMLPNAQKSAPGTPHSGLPALSLAFAIPDHPWVDGAGNANVRIAMTVGALGPHEGRLLTVRDECASGDGEATVTLDEQQGLLHADLRIGANVVSANPLLANLGLSNRGVQLFGAGFIVTREEAAALLPLPLGEGGGEGKRAQASPIREEAAALPPLPLGEGGGEGTRAQTSPIREYRNGRDLNATPRDVLVIDVFGLSANELRQRFPAIYQWLVERVKPERDAKGTSKDGAGYAAQWWLFGKPRQEMRRQLAGLPRFVATVETSKHRTFQFLDASVLPDNMLIAIASDDAALLGVLSSRVHAEWALALGGRLGVGNDPRYNKSRCFETFPFPHEDTGLTPELERVIRSLAEQIDAHRKARQAAHASVTLTGLYNVLDKLRRGETFNAKDKALNEQGLVSVLQSLHDELDAAVLQAYGWSDLGPVPWRDETARATWTETLLARLVALNAQRSAEEAGTWPGSPSGGLVRWLRPEFQDPARRAAAALAAAAAPPATPLPQQSALDGVETQAEATQAAAQAVAVADATEAASRAPGDTTTQASAATAQPWPPTLPEQVRAIAQLLAASPVPLPLPAIEAAFKGKGAWKKGLPRLLDTLEVLGRARQEGGGWRG